MLIRLLPNDIEKGWDMLSDALKKSVPDYVNIDDVGMTNLLQSLLEDKLQCWLISEEDYNENGLHGICTTMLTIDPASGTKNLLIYTLYAFRKLTEDLIKDGFNTLKNYAISKGCFKIIAYTDVPQIEQMAKMLGGKAGHTLIELEI